MVNRELLEACRRGDHRAFEELVEETHRRVYTLAYRLVGDRSEAEDVAQEAYLRVYRGLGGFREEARFETWLYRIVTNVAMSHLRRRGRFGELLTEQPEELAARDAPASEEAFAVEDVRQALERLPVGYRTVIVLRDIYDLPIRHIARELGVTEGAVKVRIHRARKRLKDVIREQGQGERSA